MKRWVLLLANNTYLCGSYSTDTSLFLGVVVCILIDVFVPYHLSVSFYRFSCRPANLPSNDIGDTYSTYSGTVLPTGRPLAHCHLGLKLWVRYWAPSKEKLFVWSVKRTTSLKWLQPAKRKLVKWRNTNILTIFVTWATSHSLQYFLRLKGENCPQLVRRY